MASPPLPQHYLLGVQRIFERLTFVKFLPDSPDFMHNVLPNGTGLTLQVFFPYGKIKAQSATSELFCLW